MMTDFYIEELRAIAHEWDCTLELDGEVGFGYECVGISRGSNYVDFSYLAWYFDEPTQEAKQAMAALYSEIQGTAPDRAYHKHECLAVLGHDDESQLQLYTWVKEIKRLGWTVGSQLERDMGPGTATMGEVLYGHRVSIPTLFKEV